VGGSGPVLLPQIAGALATVEELVPDDDGSAEAALRVVLAQRYRTVRPFLRLLAESVSPDAASGGAAVLAAVKTLAELVARKVKLKPLRPAEIDDRLIPAMWNRAVHANPDLTKGAVDRDAYVLCVLEQLHKALRVRDVFATPSHRWGDPRAQLLDGPGWEAIRPVILDGLGLTGPVQEHLRGLVGRLDAAWVQMADRFAEDTASVRIVPDVGGRMRLSVERLDALEVPEPGRVARAHRGDAAPHRPARTAAGGARLDRVLAHEVRGRAPDRRAGTARSSGTSPGHPVSDRELTDPQAGAAALTADRLIPSLDLPSGQRGQLTPPQWGRVTLSQPHLALAWRFAGASFPLLERLPCCDDADEQE